MRLMSDQQKRIQGGRIWSQQQKSSTRYTKWKALTNWWWNSIYQRVPILNQSKDTYITENSRYISICLWVILFWSSFRIPHRKIDITICASNHLKYPVSMLQPKDYNSPRSCYKTKCPPVLCFWGLCWWVQRASNNVFCWVLLRRLVFAVDGVSCHLRLLFFSPDSDSYRGSYFQ